MTTIEERISQAIDAGFTDEEIQHVLGGQKPQATSGHGRGDDPFQGDPSPSGPITKNVQPAFDPLGHVAGMQHEIRSGTPGEDLSVAENRATEHRRATENANDPVAHDPLAGQIVAGTLGAGAGRLIGEAPAIARLLGGSLPARVAGRALVGGGEGATAAAASGAGPRDIGTSALLGAGARQLTPPTTGPLDRLPARTTSGRATETIGKVGGYPAMGRPAAGGMFDEPGYRALPPGEEGTAQLAEGARTKITDSLASRDAANRAGLASTESRVEGELGDTLHSVDPIKEHIAKLRAENNNTPAGLPKDPSLEARLKQVEALMAPQKGDIEGATFGQLRGLQKSLKDEAQYGQPSTMENRPARMLEGAFKERIQGGDGAPALHHDLPPAYQSYGSEAARLEEAKNALYGGKGAIRDPEEIPMTNEERARGRLMRHGSGGASAANQGVSLEHLASQDPMYADELSRLGAHNASKDLEFRGVSPGFGGDSGILRAIAHNAGAATERFVRPLTGIGYRGGGAANPLPSLEALILMQQEQNNGHR